MPSIETMQASYILDGGMNAGAACRDLPRSPLLEHCLTVLREHRADLHARGVLHAGVFGSVARGTDKANSDIDVVVEIDYGKSFGTVGLIKLEEDLRNIFGRPVDVVSLGGLKSPKHDRILEDIVPAF
jgi:predicted nucleotidyltransferase